MGDLIITRGELGWATAGVLGLTLLLLVWSYRSAPPGAPRWVCMVCKTLGVLALLFCLLEPLWSGRRVRPGANLFVVLADNSQGLQVKDAGAVETRGEQMRSQLSSAAPNWMARLEEDFELRRYSFDIRLKSMRDFTNLSFDGRASAIHSAVRDVGQRLAGRPVAGILLLTDGNATDLADVLGEAGPLPPIYPVVLGRRGAVRDVALAQVHVSQTAFEDAPVIIRAEIGTAGLRGETVVGQLLDASGRVIESRSLRARKDAETLAFEFKRKREASGLAFYRLQAGTAADLESVSSGGESSEATWVNNTSTVVVDHGRDTHRVLYVAGRPNWEYKFLNRSIQEDRQVQLVGLIRVAKREPKFDFRGREGETSNPLFRGFGAQGPEEVERYDQPVLVRLNTRDELELRNGFPITPEDLFGYEAVILDDLEAEFFSADQSALLRRFVSERGGGLLMLGGAECFREGGYDRTLIGEMLPVRLDRHNTPTKPPQIRLSLAREGWLEAWTRLRDNEADERARLEDMPAFEVQNGVSDVKPGASTLGVVTDAAGQDHPALVTQRFGRGRTGAVLVGDLWLWGMQSPEARVDMEKAWRQLVRWLIADVPGRMEVSVEPQEGSAAGAVTLQVRVRDPRFEPVDDATIHLEVQRVSAGSSEGSTNTVRLRAESSASEAGLYTTTFVPREAGGHRVTATVTTTEGMEIHRAEAGWSADPSAAEFRSLEPNPAPLEALARRTGGEVITFEGLEGFVRDLAKKPAPVMEAWTYPAWHTPVLFTFALLCFITEWGVRRWKGLP